MVLLDGPVVVEHGQVGPGLDVKVVGGSRVVVVVDNRGEEQGEDLQVRQPILQPGLRDEPVRRLKNIPPLYSDYNTLEIFFVNRMPFSTRVVHILAINSLQSSTIPSFKVPFSHRNFMDFCMLNVA